MTKAGYNFFTSRCNASKRLWTRDKGVNLYLNLNLFKGSMQYNQWTGFYIMGSLFLIWLI